MTSLLRTKFDSIENLILSGGGPILFTYAGLLNELETSDCGFKLENIKRIYGTSAGSIIGLFLCLGLPLKDLKEYLIGRPWEKVFEISPASIFNAYQLRGILSKNVFHEMYRPVIESGDLGLTMDFTFTDLFNATGIHFSCFATNIHEKELSKALIEFSHIKTPDEKVLNGIFYSSCLPILFQPEIIDETHCYTDGGIISGFPIDKFFENHPNVENEKILGIQKKAEPSSIEPLTNEDSIFKYVSHLLNFTKRCYYYHTDCDEETNERLKHIHHIIIKESMNIELIYNAIHSSTIRQELVDRGHEVASNYLSMESVHSC